MQEFQEAVWGYYRDHGRDLPWRRPLFDPYKILLSEIMLQQTQVSRVIPKYEQFLEKFSSSEALTKAKLADVINVWSGLGYNRRAKYLHEAVRQLRDKNPWTIEYLTACKGIGYNTAAAVMTYAYNQSYPFIETNIRTVFIHHFFPDSESVSDKEIMPLIEQTLDREHPREWYWALMDYGSFLKTSAGNASRRSKHYVKQSKFEGSKRQIRGQVLRLLANKPLTPSEIKISIADVRLEGVLRDLASDGLIITRGKHIHLGS